MAFKSLSTISITVGAPFNGAVPAVAVTINSIVMRGSTAHSGKFRSITGQGPYAPLYSSLNLKGPTYVNTDPTIDTTPTLPTVLPFRAGTLESRVSYVNYLAVSSSSFTAPTINSVVMRASSGLSGDLEIVRYQAPSVAQTTYLKFSYNLNAELQIFGMINNKLYMDY